MYPIRVSTILPGRFGKVKGDYPTLFEPDCVIHVQVWVSYTRDRRLKVPSEGRNYFMGHLPNTNWTMESGCLNLTADVANQFQTFLFQEKNPIKFSPTGIWTQDLIRSKNSNHLATLSPTNIPLQHVLIQFLSSLYYYQTYVPGLWSPNY